MFHKFFGIAGRSIKNTVVQGAPVLPSNIYGRMRYTSLI